MHRRFLAFDLGAESGRAMLGEVGSGRLTLTELCRFPNDPVRANGGLHWDVLRLWHEMKRGLERASDVALDSIGVDTWGCDFALIGERGHLLESPFHYRDARTDGVMEMVLQRIGREQIYASTGSQFLQFNTLYQLYAACAATPRVVEAADALATIPDLFNYWLTGVLRSEYTIASTTQLVDAKTRSWAAGLIGQLGLPLRLLLPLVEPGHVLGDLKADVSRALAGTPVVAPACHDTGSAFAAVATDGGALLSSGTWSLLGAELRAPIVSSDARDLNFTNEGGVCGTTRLLRNIAGLWILQSCARVWARQGDARSYEELVAAARDERHAFESLFDPDHEALFHPTDMPSAIAQLCRQTGQPAPTNPAACTRAILESLAFKYRVVLEALEELTGARYQYLRIVGGGSRNRLLNQLVSDAIGRPVIAGPVEATALGNIAMQMLATGTVGSLAEAREIVDHSFPGERFEPREADRWDHQYRRFQDQVEVTRA